VDGWGVMCWSVSCWSLSWCDVFKCIGVIVRYSAVFLPNPKIIGVLSWWMVI
jgi:hypothetical protein